MDTNRNGTFYAAKNCFLRPGISTNFDDHEFRPWGRLGASRRRPGHGVAWMQKRLQKTNLLNYSIRLSSTRLVYPALVPGSWESSDRATSCWTMPKPESSPGRGTVQSTRKGWRRSCDVFGFDRASQLRPPSAPQSFELTNEQSIEFLHPSWRVRPLRIRIVTSDAPTCMPASNCRCHSLTSLGGQSIWLCAGIELVQWVFPSKLQAEVPSGESRGEQSNPATPLLLQFVDVKYMLSSPWTFVKTQTHSLDAIVKETHRVCLS